MSFNRLLRAAAHVNPREELAQVIDEIIGVHAGAGQAAFNPGQSTHTASVHRSVSASATKLLQTYGHGLNLEAKILEIKAYLEGLTVSPIHQAAKRCIERMTAEDYFFTDISGVSTRQLLALAYIAIHDGSKCSASLDDAKALFVEGLYEIQRGYNLNAQGQDLGGEDRPICSSGTFNKLMEKLNGIHDDVKVYFITHEGASSKFPRLAQEKALAYLQTLVSPQTLDDYQRVKDLIAHLKAENSLELIWETIKATVAEELWDEFKEAYGNNRSNPRFLDLINNGQYLALPDLSAIERALQSSPGYQALATHFEPYSFWANRHTSPEAQHDFDKHYALIPRL